MNLVKISTIILVVLFIGCSIFDIKPMSEDELKVRVRERCLKFYRENDPLLEKCYEALLKIERKNRGFDVKVK